MNKGCRISQIHIPQIGDLHDVSIHAVEETKVYGPSPISHRIAWLLSMCFSMRDPHHIKTTLHRFGWDALQDDIHFEGMNAQVSWKNSGFVRAFVAGQREFSIRVVVQLNTQILGWLRKKAIRNPEVIQAIMEHPTCSFRFSVMLDNLYSVASFSYVDIALGDWAIPISDKPDWLSHLFEHLQGVFCMPYALDVAKLARKALLSAEEHESYHEFSRALDTIGSVRVVESDGTPFLLIDGDPLVLYSQKVKTAVMQACAIHLTGASVVWIDEQVLCSVGEYVQLWTVCEQGAKFGRKPTKKALPWRLKKET